LIAAPALVFAGSRLTTAPRVSATGPFIVDAGKSRFVGVVKFLGAHPNDLKVSAKDTGGQLSVFEYSGTAKIGPMLHVHFKQHEIFMIIEGWFRFVVGKATHHLKAGRTIFLPRNIPHSWIQLSDFGKLIYFLQPACKMEKFFGYMNSLPEQPSTEAMNHIHISHQMKIAGPLSL